MENLFLGLLIGLIVGLIITSYVSMNTINNYAKQNKKLINSQNRLIYEKIDLIEQKQEEIKIKENAEIRATEYARKIKSIENLINSKDTIVNKYDKIVKLIFGKE